MAQNALENVLGRLHPPALTALRLSWFDLGSAPPFIKTAKVYNSSSEEVRRLAPRRALVLWRGGGVKRTCAKTPRGLEPGVKRY